MKQAIVVYSGGMDSFTLLNEVIASGEFDHVHALTFDYGQKHSKEIMFAMRAVGGMNVGQHKIVDVTSINQLLDSSLTATGGEIPEGHYEEDTMKSTVVPNRNMIMISLATGWAVSLGADTVFFGAHAGDHAIYPDCREEFVEAINEVTMIANYQSVEVRAPYLDFTKGEIALIGRKLHLDYGLAWTCYNGRAYACGKCGACQERLEAMEFAGISDPLEYEK